MEVNIWFRQELAGVAASQQEGDVNLSSTISYQLRPNLMCYVPLKKEGVRVQAEQMGLSE